MTTAQITDHVDRALARLPQMLKGKPNLEALITILVEPLQRAEDTAWQLFTERDIDTAIGVQLKLIGKIVGQGYAGEEIEIYRRMVRARVATNKSDGTPEELLTIARLVLDMDDAVLVREPGYPRGVTYRVEDVIVDDDTSTVLIRFLRAAKLDGVKLVLETWPEAAEDMLVLPITTFADGAISSSATTLIVDSTAAFPSSGSLRLSAALAVEEVVTYSGKTSTTFTGVSATTHAHVDNTSITLEDGGLGLGDEADPDVGGYLASAKE